MSNCLPTGADECVRPYTSVLAFRPLPLWLEFADEGVRATLGDAYVQPRFEEGFYAAENFRRAFRFVDFFSQVRAARDAVVNHEANCFIFPTASGNSSSISIRK